MSNTRITEEYEASLTIVYADGTTIEFPRVQMKDAEFKFEDRDLPYYYTRNLELIQLTFTPVEPWTTKLPPPETKAQKRARLIKEMYPQ